MTVVEYAKANGVTVTVLYRRMREILIKEGKKRLPTPEELKRRKAGRPRMYE